MIHVKSYRSKNFLFGLILFFSITCFTAYAINGDESTSDFDALNLIEKAQDLRGHHKLEEALSNLNDAIKLTEDKKLSSLANLEIAYIKYLQGKNSIVYDMYIKEAFKLNPSLTLQSYYDEGFKKEFKKLKPGYEEVSAKPERDKQQETAFTGNEKLENEIANAKKEVETWDNILDKRKHWAVRSEKAEKQAERNLAKAKELLKQKEKELEEFRQAQLILKQKKEKELTLETDPMSSGDLKIYEQKSLFIFPVIYKDGISSDILNDKRKMFLPYQLYKMFIMDFKRINFFDVKTDDSVDSFLQDAHSYIRNNVKRITAKRMQPDGKFKEAMVTAAALLKTTQNSFAIIPFIDSVEKKVVDKEKSTSYIYNMYVHFDIYNTKTKKKIKTLKINNKKNWLGTLSSVTGSLQVDNSDLAGLSESEKEDEKSFRNAIAGLFSVLKKKMKEMPEFRIFETLSSVSRSTFGFDLGAGTGIKIDHRYKTYVSQAEGGKRMTGFGKIRKVKASYSEAQILIGRPGEGDQVIEDPKVGINVVGSFGTAPLHINLGDDVAAGSNLCLFLGAEYELGPVLKMSELYTTLNLRVGLPRPEEIYADTNLSQIFFNLGIIKKIYFRRFALNFGGYAGIHSATLTADSIDTKGSSFGFTLNASLEMMITPSISAFGGFNLDIYPNPSKYEDNGSKYTFPDDWEWNAKGLSFNLGAKITL